MRRVLCLVPLLLAACSKSATPISIDVTTCQETTAFDDDPRVTGCDITVTSLDGSIKTTQHATPGNGFDFPDNVSGDQQVSITVSCTAGDGTQVMAGQSLSGILLSSVTSTIPVFVQRVEQWARPCAGLACSHVGGVATVAGERYLFLTGGSRASGDSTCDPTALDAYDIFGLTGDATASAFNPQPTSIVSLGTQLLLISSTGAFMLDLSNGNQQQLAAPSQLSSFADVAGGQVIYGAGGRAFVVGATRTDSPSDAVLEVDLDQTLGAFKLSAPRQGASAAWVDGTGLVVVGGSATAVGMELLTTSAATFATRPYPAVPVVGAGAVTDGVSGVILFGGVDPTTSTPTPAPTRQFQTSCNPCTTPPPLDTPSLPALGGVSAYQLAAGRDLVLGTELSGAGLLRSFIVDSSRMPIAVTEAKLREPRKGATPLPAPNGTLALLGGQHEDGTPALSVELFQP